MTDRPASPVVDLPAVRRAAATLRGVAHRTPVLTSRTLDAATGATVLAKAENQQRAGAFKLRGAYTRMAALSAAERGRGVVAFSSGNHAQAVALAGRLLSVAVTVLMPHDAPAGKRAATLGYGADVVGYDRATADREALARRLAADRGATLVPPYDDPLVIAGQGTVALELVEDAGPLDVLVVPVGGGGLLAGCATAATALCPGVAVWGVEPAAGDDTRRSLAAGRRVRIEPPATVADGLAATVPGELTFPVVRRLVAGVVCVTDAETVEAMVFGLERMGAVLEPSGAVGLAALLCARVPGVAGRRVGLVLSGGNVGAQRLARLVLDRPERGGPAPAAASSSTGLTPST